MSFLDESIRNVGERDSRKPFSPTPSGSNTIRHSSHRQEFRVMGLSHVATNDPPCRGAYANKICQGCHPVGEVEMFGKWGANSDVVFVP
ncbi:hypothetical protein TNCV_2067671 [Trichonephila clavipes]|uniref:Uncharacterized protein n=1 Tax=Trichonephila clavipes TaxID=2585209 RepID=A0A8X6W3K8_TRICX|nr:hypothetical protein TNCV_2067671 [Trichonephila clavipes]